jgi:hypothetical protein
MTAVAQAQAATPRSAQPLRARAKAGGPDVTVVMPLAMAVCWETDAIGCLRL